MHVITLCAVYSGIISTTPAPLTPSKQECRIIVSYPLFTNPPETENVIFARALRGYESPCPSAWLLLERRCVHGTSNGAFIFWLPLPRDSNPGKLSPRADPF